MHFIWLLWHLNVNTLHLVPLAVNCKPITFGAFGYKRIKLPLVVDIPLPIGYIAKWAPIKV